MSNQDSTKKELMEAVAGVKQNTEQILEAIGVYSNKTEGRLHKIEANMVTRDYLDEKLSDLKGDLSILLRKEDRKLGELVIILKEKKVISSEDVKRILAMEPFPQS